MVPGVSRAAASDKVLGRAIWRALSDLVLEAAEHHDVTDPRMPRSTYSPSVPSDLTSGISLSAASNLLKIQTILLTYSDDSRAMVTIVPPESRYDRVDPTPAAFLDGSTLYPIPGDGDAIWTHARMLEAGWSDVSTITVEFIQGVAEPASGSVTVPVDTLFHRPALYRAGLDIVAGHAPEFMPVVQSLFLEAWEKALTSLVRPIAPEIEVVRAVW